MKKMNRYDLETMARELHTIHEEEQRKYLGGNSCEHGVDTQNMCPKCQGITPISFQLYSYLDELNKWPGGWVEFSPGQYSFVMPNTGVVVTGNIDPHCKGLDCKLDHQHFCLDHGEFFFGTSGCTVCNAPSGILSGYCEIHQIYYPGGGSGVCPDCSGEPKEEPKDETSGDSGLVSGSYHCSLHGDFIGNVCPNCYPVGGPDTGDTGNTGDHTDPLLPTRTPDYVVKNYTDETFSKKSCRDLKSSIENVLKNDVGQFIYNELSLSEDFVTFTIGETKPYWDEKIQEHIPAPAQYQNGVITFHPDTEIDHQLLLEEFVHAVQQDTYGSVMTNKDLNYEFEAKVIGCMYLKGAGTDWGFKDKDDEFGFRDFCGKIAEGYFPNENEMMKKYWEYFEKWNDQRYTGDKIHGFDPKVVKKFMHK